MNNQSFWSNLIVKFFDPDALHLSMTMTSQSMVKHFLTEGDKFLVSYWSPLEDQGGYAIAVNYGLSPSNCNMTLVSYSRSRVFDRTHCLPAN